MQSEFESQQVLLCFFFFFFGVYKHSRQPGHFAFLHRQKNVAQVKVSVDSTLQGYLLPLKEHKNKTKNNLPPMVSFLEWLHLLQ